MEKTKENKLPLTRTQKLIGKLMLRSKQERAFIYLQAHADLTELNTVRKACCKSSGVRVTTNDFFFAAIARAVKEFSLITANLDRAGENILLCDNVGVGFAVSTAQGLVVPVIKNITEKNLVQIARESDALIKKARANKLKPDDFDDASIVLTGLGMYGIDSFYAIAPPQATAIISIGRPTDTAVLIDGEIAVRKIISVSLAVDRRIVDDFYAAKFMQKLVALLEKPESLVDKPE